MSALACASLATCGFPGGPVSLPKHPTAADIDAYNKECAERRKTCEASTHRMRRMTSHEAYPSSAGEVCAHCDLVKLVW